MHIRNRQMDSRSRSGSQSALRAGLVLGMAILGVGSRGWERERERTKEVREMDAKREVGEMDTKREVGVVYTKN